MSFEVERQILEGQFKTGWNASGASAVPIFWDAVPFEPVDGSPYVRVTILNGDSYPASIGGEMGRNFGFFIVDIFGSESTGSSVCRQLADYVKTIMSLKNINQGVSNLKTFQTRIRRMQPGPEGGYRLQTETEFIRDDQQ